MTICQIPTGPWKTLICVISSYVSNIIFEVFERAIKLLKESKGLQIRKKEVQVSLFADDMIYTEKILKIPPGNVYDL